MFTRKYSSKRLGILYIILCTLTIGILFSYNFSTGKAAKKPSISTKSATIFINGSYTISVKNKKAKSTCFFTSNKTNIAKVNSKGKITGVGKGSAQIKVRYKYKKRFYNIGTFKITVKKSTINPSYKATDINMTTGQKLSASSYLTTINKSATYIITSSDSDIAKGTSDGTIIALKSGKASLSIHEVYNGRSRTIGCLIVTIEGSSLKSTSIKMPYSSTLDISQILNNMSSSSTYKLTSNNTKLVSIDDNIIETASRGTENASCTVDVYETIIDTNSTRKIGTLTITLTNSAYIAIDDQTVYLGLGSKLEIGAVDNIHISNPADNATYSIEAASTSILSDDLVAKKYGKTTVKIKETINGKTRILPDTINVVIERASIKDELLIDGLTTMVEGDTYGKYPVKCRNRNYTYSYETKDKSVCDVKSAGTHADEDYLVIDPKNIGSTIITVYEKTSSSSTKRTKLGSFGVTVTADTSVLPEDINASDIIKNISVTSNGKTYSGVISDEDLTCTFSDEDDNGFLDYGTKLEDITAGDFNITFKKAKYRIISVDTSDGSDWTFTLGLGTNNSASEDDSSDDTEETTVDLTVTLKTADFDTASIIKNIKVKVGATTKTITSSTPFNDDKTLMQFAEGNKNFEALFTTAQFISAGATEFKDDVEDPVSFSDLKNVSCTVTPNTYNSKSNTSGNAAVKQITSPISEDNSEWTFTVTFEDGTTEDCSVKIDRLDD